jgi:hypothetical protein
MSAPRVERGAATTPYGRGSDGRLLFGGAATHQRRDTTLAFDAELGCDPDQGGDQAFHMLFGMG